MSAPLLRRLPFLNGLRAFEAAARNGGFAGAAREMNLSAAAISRLVGLLEVRLGVVLFQRKANRLALTAAGTLYQAGLSTIFNDLIRLSETVANQGKRQVLTLGVGPTFAIRWLIPRLAAFQAEVPEVEVRIVTGGAAAPFDPDWTCGIRLGNGAWPGLIAEPLFPADLLPVTTPARAAALHRPADLAQSVLVRVGHAPQDWPDWLAAVGAIGVMARGPQFEFYGQALQAAADGVGVAMGIRPYIDDDLRAGRLVAPFPQSVPKGGGWYLIYQHRRASEPGFGAFRRWVQAASQF